MDTIGRAAYPDPTRLLITADAGGSDGNRLRLWKTELATFAAQPGLAVTVLHFPSGTSKWNKIEDVDPASSVGRGRYAPGRTSAVT